MADDKIEPRDVTPRARWAWTELFRGFQLALDPYKLLLAAAGILIMAAGWWVLAVIFYTPRARPQWPEHYQLDAYRPANEADPKKADQKAEQGAWKAFQNDRRKWNLLHKAAGPADKPVYEDAGDLADNPAEYKLIKDKVQPAIDSGTYTFEADHKPYVIHPKPAGRLRTWPWFEDRGPNPYLAVTGTEDEQVTTGWSPWQKSENVGLFLARQLPVLVEPLVKFLRPVVYLLQPRIGFLNWLYFSLVLVWTLATWALFGGAITRMAAVQVARKEKIGPIEAIRFTLSRYLHFFSAPLFPLILVLIITVFLIIYGLLHWIPIFGDIVVDGLGWPLVLLAGLVMAVILVGLVGWPMMYSTISAEGSDNFDALSRSYSYVYQCPWHYVWYSIVALAYGAVLVFFVGFMGSLMVYLGKWGVGQTPGVERTGRGPSYLFVYAPTSYQWRELLLQGALTDEDDGSRSVVKDGAIDSEAYKAYTDGLTWFNKTGAVMVSGWMYLIFLMVIGFGYSYFWSAGTIVYLLMRRKVDDTELDEVYLEEDESDEAYSANAPPAPAPAPAAPEPGLTMVESPSLRSSAPPPPPEAPAAKAESAPPAKGDGDAPGE
ncbi:MAG TPA: hypothetical protein VG013_37635 [Gemmataceae bacterium]|jgi:hypothetical protein|nr:hypothetical protein [Gemmataceae bacterium]